MISYLAKCIFIFLMGLAEPDEPLFPDEAFILAPKQ
jgi:hypothetical protein